MCQKQCRDENGFKCHCQSESHKRQMLLFAQNSGKILDEFSTDFETGFMDVLSRRHGTKRMHCNVVYQEYINDKQHAHMNSTRWESLSSFVQHLGRTGKAVIDETEKVRIVTTAVNQCRLMCLVLSWYPGVVHAIHR
jgi:DNA/RNA-binding protein KIN17